MKKLSLLLSLLLMAISINGTETPVKRTSPFKAAFGDRQSPFVRSIPNPRSISRQTIQEDLFEDISEASEASDSDSDNTQDFSAKLSRSFIPIYSPSELSETSMSESSASFTPSLSAGSASTPESFLTQDEDSGSGSDSDSDSEEADALLAGFTAYLDATTNSVAIKKPTTELGLKLKKLLNLYRIDHFMTEQINGLQVAFHLFQQSPLVKTDGQLLKVFEEMILKWQAANPKSPEISKASEEILDYIRSGKRIELLETIAQLPGGIGRIINDYVWYKN